MEMPKCPNKMIVWYVLVALRQPPWDIAPLSLRKCACSHGEHGNDGQRATGGQTKSPHYSVAQIWRMIPNPKRVLRVHGERLGLKGPWLLGWSLVIRANSGRTCMG